MLDLIYIGSADLFGIDREQKIKLKMKIYVSSAGFESTQRQSTTGKSAL